METPNLPAIRALRPTWNKGRIVGRKRPLKPKHVWAIRVRLELAENYRDLALFNLAIDSKLRGCDLVKMKVVDVMASGQIKERASVLQSKTQKPVRFEISEGTRASLARWMREPLMIGSEHLWPGPFHERLHFPTRQYARIVREWVKPIGLEVSACGAQRSRRSTRRRATRGRSNFCWGIPRWTALLDTSALNLKMRWLSPKLSKFKRLGRLHGRPIADSRRPIGICIAALRKRSLALRAAFKVI